MKEQNKNNYRKSQKTEIDRLHNIPVDQKLEINIFLVIKKKIQQSINLCIGHDDSVKML